MGSYMEGMNGAMKDGRFLGWLDFFFLYVLFSSKDLYMYGGIGLRCAWRAGWVLHRFIGLWRRESFSGILYFILLLFQDVGGLRLFKGIS